MSRDLFEVSERDGREILVLKPAATLKPLARMFDSLTYGIEEGRRLVIRSGALLKNERHINIADIIEIELTRSAGSTAIGLGAADLSFRTSSPTDFRWENIRNAAAIRDFIYALRDRKAGGTDQQSASGSPGQPTSTTGPGNGAIPTGTKFSERVVILPLIEELLCGGLYATHRTGGLWTPKASKHNWVARGEAIFEVNARVQVSERSPLVAIPVLSPVSGLLLRVGAFDYSGTGPFPPGMIHNTAILLSETEDAPPDAAVAFEPLCEFCSRNRSLFWDTNLPSERRRSEESVVKAIQRQAVAPVRLMAAKGSECAPLLGELKYLRPELTSRLP